jgi:MAP/microtubule affinity-regulating kinase
VNLEELKLERAKLIQKIAYTFKKKSKAPSTTSEFYRILHVLGKGAFAKVCLAI